MVTITWATEGNADTYTIVIKKGNDVFCTLTFNKDGQFIIVRDGVEYNAVGQEM